VGLLSWRVLLTPLSFALGAIAACSLDATGTGPFGANAADAPDASGKGPHEADRDAMPPMRPDVHAPPPVEAGPAGEGHDASARDAAGTDEAGSNCDEDGDGFRAAGACGGSDCCDTDPATHPGVTAWFDAASKCGHFDFDCDGAETHEYPTQHCVPSGLAACGGDGFEKDTACGQQASYEVCTWVILECRARDEDRVQRCH
jgi:hypothetical protein